MSDGRIRDELAQALIDNDLLRHEVTRIAMSGLDGRPSDTYVAWKHRVNALARSIGIPIPEMLAAVVDRAIDMNRT